MSIWSDIITRSLSPAVAVLQNTATAAEDAARVVRFVRESQRFTSRPHDIFVVSYPRSGTTWSQYILHLLAHQHDTFTHIGEVVPWWERHLASGIAGASDFDRLINPRIFKSHLLPRWLPKDGRFIYLLRDGKDVAISYYELYRTHLGFTGSLDAFMKRFFAGRVQYGSWFQHVRQWQARQGNRQVLFIEFEDLKRDTMGTIGKMARFCGISVPPRRLEEVTAATSLPRMKEQEQRFDHIGELLRERKIVRDSFIRTGVPGAGQQALSSAHMQRFDEQWKRTTHKRHREWKLHAFLR